MKATTTTGKELSLGERKYERHRTWTYLAIAGIACYVAIDVALAFLHPQYSLVRNAESDYGVGAYSWLMDLNFLLRCAFSLAAVAALARYRGGLRARFGLVLLTLWAIASGLLAFVPDNPPGAAATASGQNHIAIAGIAFLAIAGATLLISRDMGGEASWRGKQRWLLGLSLIALVPLGLSVVAMNQHAGNFGLFERCFLGAEILWLYMALSWGRDARPELVSSAAISSVS